jgi:hypothetical protein
VCASVSLLNWRHVSMPVHSCLPNAHTHAHTYTGLKSYILLCMYCEFCRDFYMQSYMAYIYGSGQPYTHIQTRTDSQDAKHNIHRHLCGCYQHTHTHTRHTYTHTYTHVHTDAYNITNTGPRCCNQPDRPRQLESRNVAANCTCALHAPH